MGIITARRRCSFLQAVVFAGPLNVIALAEMNLFIEPALDILNRAGKIAAAHAEFHRDVALAVLAVDHERAFVKRDVGDLAERDAIALGCGQQDVANGFGRAAKFRLVTHDEIEAAVAFENLRRRPCRRSRLARRR